MSDFISLFKEDLYKLTEDLKKKGIIKEFNKEKISVDHSSKSKKGHLSTNIFIILLKKNLKKNFKLKNYILNYFNNLKYIENIEIAKIGFINIFIKKNYISLKLKELFNETNKENQKFIKNKKINIEFVSANPTGPLHLAHIRGAVLGDVLSSILKTVGYDVTREYYVNDAGSQIDILANSLYKRYQQQFKIDIKLTKNDYPGNYLIEIAKKIKKSDGDKWISYPDNIKKKNYFKNYAVTNLIDKIKKDLKLINISFDQFTFESQIVTDKYIDKVFNLLNKNDLIYKGILNKPLGDEGKDWEPRKQLLFRSTNFDDDSDRPFKKSNGEWTYFANDSAYHYQKYTRGYDKLINIWGADHIGYIQRMKSIVDVVSNKKNYLEIYICQIVRLIKNGELLKMSKREGNFITLKDIYKEVGKDALRYSMISTKSETPMDFDMNKVIEKNKDNPVFYCQYAYARASSVIRKSNEIIKIPKIEDSLNLFDISYVTEYEWKIILKILSWPYVLNQTAKNKQPHRITNYLEDLSSKFHSFWNKGKDNTSLRMIDENNIHKTITTLIWIQAFRKTFYDAFKIIGIEAPEVM